jgi:hypothetical protein
MYIPITFENANFAFSSVHYAMGHKIHEYTIRTSFFEVRMVYYL